MANCVSGTLFCSTPLNHGSGKNDASVAVCVRLNQITVQEISILEVSCYVTSKGVIKPY